MDHNEKFEVCLELLPKSCEIFGDFGCVFCVDRDDNDELSGQLQPKQSTKSEMKTNSELGGKNLNKDILKNRYGKGGKIQTIFDYQNSL